MRNLWFSILAAAFAAVFLSGCVDRNAQQQAAATRKIVTDPSTLVTTVEAKTEDVPELLSLTGSITTGDDAAIGAKNAGRLVSVLVKDGDEVHAGQIIAQQETSDAASRVSQARSNVESARAQLDQAQNEAKIAPTKSTYAIRASEARLAQAQAQLKKLQNGSRSQERIQAQLAVDRSKSDLDTAEKSLTRTRNLVKEGALAEQDLEAAQNRYDTAMATYRSALESMSLTNDSSRPEDISAAQDNVRQAQEQLKIDRDNKKLDPSAQSRVEAARASLESAQEALRQAQTFLGDLTIRSSFNGHISGKPTEVGTYLAPGTTVARVIGTGGVYYQAEVTENQVARLQPGMQVSVSIDALPGVRLSGKIVGINPLASTTGRLFTVRVSLEEKVGLLRPGMFARGSVTLGVLRGAITVPSEALLVDGENISIFAAEGGKAKLYKVHRGQEQDGRSVITGLPPSTRVVVQGQSTLRDGAPIQEAKGKGN